jgi:hypothetical protein
MSLSSKKLSHPAPTAVIVLLLVIVLPTGAYSQANSAVPPSIKKADTSGSDAVIVGSDMGSAAFDGTSRFVGIPKHFTESSIIEKDINSVQKRLAVVEAVTQTGSAAGNLNSALIRNDDVGVASYGAQLATMGGACISAGKNVFDCAKRLSAADSLANNSRDAFGYEKDTNGSYNTAANWGKAALTVGKGAACTAGALSGGVAGCAEAMDTAQLAADLGTWAANKGIDWHFNSQQEAILRDADANIPAARARMRAERAAAVRQQIQAEQAEQQAEREAYIRENSPTTEESSDSGGSFINNLLSLTAAVAPNVAAQQQRDSYNESNAVESEPIPSGLPMYRDPSTVHPLPMPDISARTHSTSGGGWGNSGRSVENQGSSCTSVCHDPPCGAECRNAVLP